MSLSLECNLGILVRRRLEQIAVLAAQVLVEKRQSVSGNDLVTPLGVEFGRVASKEEQEVREMTVLSLCDCDLVPIVCRMLDQGTVPLVCLRSHLFHDLALLWLGRLVLETMVHQHKRTRGTLVPHVPEELPVLIHNRLHPAINSAHLHCRCTA